MTFDYSEVMQKLSEPLRKKVEHSIDILRKAERLALAYDEENGYYLAFSGGKDSQCLYHVAQLAGVKLKAHMSLTSVDPPEVIRFVKREYPDVELIKPKKSIFQCAIEKQILPTMRVRWCCREYKESAGAGKVTLIGIRHAESTRRSKRNEVEIGAETKSRRYSGNLDGLDDFRKEKSKEKRGRKPAGYKEVNITNADGERVLGCIRGRETLLVSPIIEWSDEEVWEFLGVLGVKHCELYDDGWKRIGCICCPMSSPKHHKVEEKRWPHVKRNWIKAIKAIRNGGRYSKENLYGGTSGRTADCGVRVPTQQQGAFYQRQDNATLSFSASHGFSDSSSSDRLTEEQGNEIAENIYDWWTSKKSYDKWYAGKFLQKELKF